MWPVLGTPSQPREAPLRKFRSWPMLRPLLSYLELAMRIIKITGSRNRALIGTAVGAAFALAAAVGIVRAGTVVTEEWLFGSGGVFDQHPDWYPPVTVSSGNVLMTIPQPFIDALNRANIPLRDMVRQILGGKVRRFLRGLGYFRQPSSRIPWAATLCDDLSAGAIGHAGGK